MRSSSASAEVRPSTVERACERFSARYRCRRPSSATCARRSRMLRGCSGLRKARPPATVPVLERRLAAMEELAPYAALPGAGAAGGLGAALAALGARLVEGAPAVLDLVGFDTHLPGCDLVVTGEGQVDRTTAEGKAPGEVARRCAAAGVRCVVFGGRVVEPVTGTETVSLSGDRANAENDLEELGRRLARLARFSGCEPVGHRLEHLPRDCRAETRRTA